MMCLDIPCGVCTGNVQKHMWLLYCMEGKGEEKTGKPEPQQNKSYSKSFRQARIRWVIWPSSMVGVRNALENYIDCHRAFLVLLWGRCTSGSDSQHHTTAKSSSDARPLSNQRMWANKNAMLRNRAPVCCASCSKGNVLQALHGA